MSDEREKPATDPSGVEAIRERWSKRVDAMTATDALTVGRDATDVVILLALIQSLTKERDSLLGGMREIVALKEENRFEGYDYGYNDALSEAKQIANRHIEGAGK